MAALTFTEITEKLMLVQTQNCRYRYFMIDENQEHAKF